MAKYTVHGGHAAPGNLFTGAVGYCSESYVDRQIKNALIMALKAGGNLVADCTVDKGISQSNIISQIKKKINAESNVTANISIHLNAVKKRAKDGKTTGVECCVYSKNSDAYNKATKICAEIAKLGFTNRGVKIRTNLGVLKGITNGGANILVECFFCDDEDDFLLYSKVGAAGIAKAITAGLGANVSTTAKISGYILGRYIINDPEFGKTDLGYVFDPEYYKANGYKNATEKPVFNAMTNATAYEHFKNFGIKEGRRANKYFDVEFYKRNNLDLQQKYGSDWSRYYKHFCKHGVIEGRKGI